MRTLCNSALGTGAAFILAAAFMAAAPGCGDRVKMEKVDMGPGLEKISPEMWERLSRRKIFFGHQSVGNNILAGVEEVAASLPSLELSVEETSDSAVFDSPVLGHARVGENMDPFSKISAFAAYMDSGVGDKAEIAFFKFCYVDFKEGADVPRIFDEYRRTLSRLQEAYPRTKFVHFTVPLRTVQSGGPRVWIKKIVGRPAGGYADNMKRAEFNTLLRETYGGEEPLFDLAEVESIGPGGTRESFTVKGTHYQALVPSYTDDGGHLNSEGRKVVAEKLLAFLARL